MKKNEPDMVPGKDSGEQFDRETADKLNGIYLNMNTYTGRQFAPMRITPEDVCLEDIAHALSLLCRGGGQLRWFYSVGQHSINCAREALARGWSERMALICLLHDASEAYISDIIRPVKMHLSNYREIEDMIMGVILDAFHLSPLSEGENRRWRQIDNEVLTHEVKALFPAEASSPTLPLVSEPDLSERAHREIEAAFLAMARELIEKI